MADPRQDRDTNLEPYVPRPIPDADASPSERLYWDHAEELRVYTQEARMDRGHTAVGMNAKHILACMELYHAARLARIAEADASKSRGDVAGRILAAFGKQPAALQDEVYAGIVAIIADR